MDILTYLLAVFIMSLTAFIKGVVIPYWIFLILIHDDENNYFS
jgi:hypothetical protein